MTLKEQLEKQIQNHKIQFDKRDDDPSLSERLKSQLLNENAGQLISERLQRLILFLSYSVDEHVRISSLVRENFTNSHHATGRAVDIGNEKIAPKLLPVIADEFFVQSYFIDEIIFDAGGETLKERNRWNYKNGKKKDDYSVETLVEDKHHEHIHFSVKDYFNVPSKIPLPEHQYILNLLADAKESVPVAVEPDHRDDIQAINAKWKEFNDIENRINHNDYKNVFIGSNSLNNSEFDDLELKSSQYSSLDIENLIQTVFSKLVKNEFSTILNPISEIEELYDFFEVNLLDQNISVEFLEKYFNPKYINSQSFSSIEGKRIREILESVQKELKHGLDTGLDIGEIGKRASEQLEFNTISDNFYRNVENFSDAAKEIWESKIEILNIQNTELEILNSIHDFGHNNKKEIQTTINDLFEKSDTDISDTDIKKALETTNQISDQLKSTANLLQSTNENSGSDNIQDQVKKYVHGAEAIGLIANNIGLKELSADINGLVSDANSGLQLAEAVASGNYLSAGLVVSSKIFGKRRRKKDRTIVFLQRAFKQINIKLHKLLDGQEVIKHNQYTIIENQDRILKTQRLILEEIHNVSEKIEELRQENQKQFIILSNELDKLHESVQLNRELLNDLLNVAIELAEKFGTEFSIAPKKVEYIASITTSKVASVHIHLSHHTLQFDKNYLTGKDEIPNWYQSKYTTDLEKYREHQEDIVKPLYSYLEVLKQKSQSNELPSKLIKCRGYIWQPLNTNGSYDNDLSYINELYEYFRDTLNTEVCNEIFISCLKFFPLSYKLYSDGEWKIIDKGEIEENIETIAESHADKTRTLTKALDFMIKIIDIALLQENSFLGGSILKELWTDLSEGNNTAIKNCLKKNEVLQANLMMYILKEELNISNFIYSLSFNEKDPKPEFLEKKIGSNFRIIDTAKRIVKYRECKFKCVPPEYYRTGKLIQTVEYLTLVQLKDRILRFRNQYLFGNSLSKKEIKSYHTLLSIE